MKFKINEDKYYSATADTFSYFIKNGDSTIFKGRTYKNPSETASTINITKICRDWVTNTLPDFRGFTDSAVSQTEAYQQFDLYTYSTIITTGGTETIPVLLETYNILFDWDSTAWSGQSCTLSNPVNGRADSRMRLLYSVYRDTTGETICWDKYVYPIIKFSPDSILFSPFASSTTITITSNTDYTLSTNTDWLTISSSSGGSGVTYFTVSTTVNNELTERNGVVIIHYYDIYSIENLMYVNIRQECGYVRITASKTNIGNEGETVSINVVSNKDWTFEIDYE